MRERTVRNRAELRAVIRDLAGLLKCGEEAEVLITSPNVLAELPAEVMSLELSLVSIKEVGRGFLATVINRFGKACRER